VSDSTHEGSRPFNDLTLDGQPWRPSHVKFAPTQVPRYVCHHPNLSGSTCLSAQNSSLDALGMCFSTLIVRSYVESRLRLR
jgi:hypothetical protein